ncbi:MAG: radical SAM protein [Bacteroidales bacterium]|nr:radical SAM protein [Bacteroidales bacterium]
MIDKYNKLRTGINISKICYAHFNSLYFESDGTIKTCGAKQYSLGKYPDITIKEAWEGETIKDLRQEMENGLFPDSCYLCKTQIKEGALESTFARFHDIDKPCVFPQIISFECSEICNLKCIMCYNNRQNKIRLTNQSNNIYNDNFIKELIPIIPYVKIANFYGGEPFLNPLYFNIWEEFVKLNPNCQIQISTNGTILNDAVKKILDKGNFNIILSIDSLNKNTYEKIRVNSDLNLVLSNLEYFLNYCNIKNKKLHLVACFMQQNWQDIPDLIKFCNKNQIQITFNRVWHPENNVLYNSSSDLLNKIINYYKTVYLEKNTTIEKSNYGKFLEIFNQTIIWKNELLEKENELKKYDNYSNNELIDVLKMCLENYNKKNTKEINYLKVYELIDELIKQEDTDNNKRLILLYYLKLPPELIYSIYKSGCY